MSGSPKYRRPLNEKQIKLLKIIYKFRFVTVQLISEVQNIKKQAAYQRLQVLIDQEYIGKKYDSSYRLQNKHARYYLLPKAILLLNDAPNLNAQVLHSNYKNKNHSMVFIDHTIDVANAYLSLQKSYSKTFHMLTRSETASLEQFPDPKPDLYIRRVRPLENIPNDYFLYIYTDTQPFIIKKHLSALLEHYDSGDWEADTSTPYPALLLTCPNSRSENYLQRFVSDLLDNMGIDELQILTTTTSALLSSNSTREIWSSVYDPERLCALN